MIYLFVCFIDQAHNFYIANGSLTFGIAYDVRSIMHYQSDSFNKPGTYTIVEKVSLSISSWSIYKQKEGLVTCLYLLVI